MGGPKAELRLGGIRLIDRAVAALRGSGCEPVVAVVRAGTAVEDAIAVLNPDPRRGMRSSLELAVAACAEPGTGAQSGTGTDPGTAARSGGGAVEGIAVVLVDMPGVDARAVRDVVTAWTPGRIALGSYPGGARGHPIVMSVRSWAEAIAGAGADEGARAFLRDHAALVDLVPVAGTPHDLDTPADLARWTT